MRRNQQLTLFRCRRVWHFGRHGSHTDRPRPKCSTMQDQSLGRHSRRVNPQEIPAISQLVCHTVLSITFAFSKISGGA